MNLKKILFIILLCSLGATPYILYYPKIKVEVYNKTIFNIDSLNIDNNFYSIPKGKSLIIKCRSLTLQDGLLFGEPKAKIDGMKKSNFKPFICETGITTVRTGDYAFDIKSLVEKNEYILFWEKHK
ncbi:hypothetical protein GCM10011508_21220 [Flavobacterium lutivivi]|nr:hypothetical protein GCM10011508_21220 [Flavobacterium lutivivi]